MVREDIGSESWGYVLGHWAKFNDIKNSPKNLPSPGGRGFTLLDRKYSLLLSLDQTLYLTG